MNLLYQILKFIVKVSLRFFYSKTTFENRERGYFKNPCLVVTNHQSTLLDPLNGVAWIGPSVNFLANASLFKSAFGNWFFSTLYCIKVERYQDTQGKPLNNAKAFERARKHLESGKPIFLAPEGGSFPNRELRRLKTGFARIAFDAESANSFELGLTVLPIGLNYGDPRLFRSELYTKFGEHIRVADFKEAYEKDPQQGVRELTDFLTESMKSLLVTTESKEEEYLQRKLEILLQNTTPLTPKENLERNQKLLVFLRNWGQKEHHTFKNLKETLDHYFQKIETSKTFNSPYFFEKARLKDFALHKGANTIGSMLRLLVLLISFPVFLLGFLSNILPTFFPGFMNRKLNPDPSYDATFKIVTGVFLFPLFYWLQIVLIEFFFQVNWFSLIYIFIFILTGFFAEWYLKFWTITFAQIKFRKRDDLRMMRKGILKQLNF